MAQSTARKLLFTHDLLAWRSKLKPAKFLTRLFVRLLTRSLAPPNPTRDGDLACHQASRGADDAGAADAALTALLTQSQGDLHGASGMFNQHLRLIAH